MSIAQIPLSNLKCLCKSHLFLLLLNPVLFSNYITFFTNCQITFTYVQNTRYLLDTQIEFSRQTKGGFKNYWYVITINIPILFMLYNRRHSTPLSSFLKKYIKKWHVSWLAQKHFIHASSFIHSYITFIYGVLHWLKVTAPPTKQTLVFNGFFSLSCLTTET